MSACSAAEEAYRDGMANNGRRHRVVVVGGGFGGLQAALKLSRVSNLDVTLVDRRNFHLFQPLAYQVATGALSPGEIASPLRSIFKRRRNVQVLMAEVSGFDLEARTVELEPTAGPLEARTVEYESLVVAGGSQYSYFGHEEWAGLAPELKSVESLLLVRHQILSAFEAAELESDPDLRQAWLTFVVVGGGPTGVEMAGQIGELARDTLRRDYRDMDPRKARILLAEGADRILTSFPPKLSAKAERSLQSLGVETLTGHLVVDMDETAVTMETADHRLVVPARTVIWAAGVTASPLARMLAEASGAEVDRVGRLTVGPDLSLPGHPEVFAIGDMVQADVPVPGVAPVAMQEGRYVARAIRERVEGRRPRPFRYVDKGNVATIGRARAVADVHGVGLWGFPAWVLWLGIHLWYLIGFQNRVLVLMRWTFSFLTRGRGARLITGEVPVERRPPVRS
jgi:NADH:ubiquinone reductase (H+-translocating)